MKNMKESLPQKYTYQFSRHLYQQVQHRDLFQYRFELGEGLKGHSFGNLFITAMTKITGDFEQAVQASSKVLAIRGRVLPSTSDKVTLVGQFMDGTALEGETNITGVAKPLRNIRLKPEDCKACQEAIDAISIADLIILGPGSLYTSIIPNLLIKEIREAVLNSDAYRVYICNAMTQPGETAGFSAFDHLNILLDHTDPRIVDACFVNTAPVPDPVLQRYQKNRLRFVYFNCMGYC